MEYGRRYFFEGRTDLSTASQLTQTEMSEIAVLVTFSSSVGYMLDQNTLPMDSHTSSGTPNGSRKRRRTEFGKTTGSQVPSSNSSLNSLLRRSGPLGQLGRVSSHIETNNAKQKKGENEEGDDEEDPYGDDDWGDIELPNDTMATILALQREFYGGREVKNPESWSTQDGKIKTRTGIILQHQL